MRLSAGPKRWLYRLGMVLLALLLAASLWFTWLINDEQRVRGAIESVVSGLVERPFRIEGGFDFDLGRVTSLRADRIRLLGSAATGAPSLLEIHGFSGGIDLFTLFARPVVFTRVQADQVNIHMQWDGQGNLNWPAGDPAQPARVIPDNPALLPLVLHQGEIRDLRLNLQHPALTEELKIGLQDVRQRRGERGRVTLSANALLDDRQLRVVGHMTPQVQEEVIRAVEFDLQVEGPLATLSANGAFGLPGALEDVDFTATLLAPSANDLAQRLKLPIETRGGVRFDASLGGEGEQVQADINGFFGDYRLAANFRSDDLDSLQGLEISAQTNGPSARLLGMLIGMPGLPDAAYQFQTEARNTGKEVQLQSFHFETQGLQVDGKGTFHRVPEFRDIDLQVTVAGDDFATVSPLPGGADAQTEPFSLRLTVAGNGAGTDDRVDAWLEVAGATVSLQGTLSEAPDLVGSRFRYNLESVDVQRLAAIVGWKVPGGTGLQMQGAGEITENQLRLPDLQVTLGESVLRGDASMARGLAQPAAEFVGKVQGKDLAQLLGHWLPKAARHELLQRSFAADTRLKLAPGVLHVDSVDAQLGQNRVKFDGQADLTQAGVELSGGVSVQGESLADLLKGLWRGRLPDTRFQLASDVQASSSAIHFTGLALTTGHGNLAGKLSFSGKGYSAASFDLDASGESLHGLLPQTVKFLPNDVPFQITLKGAGDKARIGLRRVEGKLGDIDLFLEGDLQVYPSLAGRKAHMRVAGPRLSDFGGVGPWKFAPRPFRITASLRGDQAEQHIEALEFESGGNNLTGRVRRSDRAGRPYFDVALNSTLLNLEEILAAPPARDSAGVDGATAPMFSHQPLPFEILDSFDAAVSLKVDRFDTRQQSLRDLVAEASLRQGVVRIEHAQIDAVQGKFVLKGISKPTPGGRSFDIDMSATHAKLPFSEMTQAEVEELPEHSLAAQLSMRGNTPQELAASTDGFLWILGGEGHAQKSMPGLLTGDLVGELLVQLNPFSKDKDYAQLECQGLFFEIAGGKLSTSPLVIMQLQHATILATGTVDLATERIDFEFESIPRRGLGFSLGDYTNPLVRMTGTLREPKMVLNPKGALLEGGAAVATSGISVLLKSLSQRLLGGGSCEAVAGKAVELRRKRDPDSLPDMQQLMVGVGIGKASDKGSAGDKSRGGEKQQSVVDEMPDW